MTKLDPLDFGFLRAQDVSTAAFKVIDALQDMKPAVQVTAVTALFLLLCEHYQVEYPTEEMTRALRLLNAAENFDTTRAIRQYIRKELT